MKSVVYMLRQFLRPWWGKLSAVVLVCVLMLGWYGLWVYNGYVSEKAIIKSLVSDKMGDENSFGFDLMNYTYEYTNVLPEWMKPYKGVYVYGERVKSIYSNGRALSKELTGFTRLEAITLGSLDLTRKEGWPEQLHGVKKLFLLNANVTQVDVDSISKWEQLEEVNAMGIKLESIQVLIQSHIHMNGIVHRFRSNFRTHRRACHSQSVRMKKRDNSDSI